MSCEGEVARSLHRDDLFGFVAGRAGKPVRLQAEWGLAGPAHREASRMGRLPRGPYRQERSLLARVPCHLPGEEGVRDLPDPCRLAALACGAGGHSHTRRCQEESGGERDPRLREVTTASTEDRNTDTNPGATWGWRQVSPCTSEGSSLCAQALGHSGAQLRIWVFTGCPGSSWVHRSLGHSRFWCCVSSLIEAML